MSNYQSIEFKSHDRIATIMFNRPDAANGLNLEMASEFAAVAQACADDSELKAIILTGSGRFFCAGGDVHSMHAHPVSPGAGVSEIADQLHKALSILARCDLPVIVAVNGTAAGAGFSVAVAGDMVIVAESAKFTMAYTKVGLSPDGSSTYTLPRLIGLRKTQDLMLTNRVLSAREALDWGLVNSVVADDELINEANALASAFSSEATGSHAAIKKLLLASGANDLETQMALESATISNCADSTDGREGVAAFVEKRKPEFT